MTSQVSKEERSAQGDAIRILDSHRIMSIATNRPDGWPQNTIVGYANIGLTVYFVVFRSSQKLANIRNDPRVAISVGHEPSGLDQLAAVYAGGLAQEVTDQTEKAQAWKLLGERHQNLVGLNLPTAEQAAVMRVKCQYVSLLDYRVAFGHHASFEVDRSEVAPS